MDEWLPTSRTEQTCVTRRRGGFTLVECLVALAVIGLLAALLLPAIQRAREASRRASCANRLRQLGIALHNYHTAFSVFPPGSQVQDYWRPPAFSKSFGWTVAILPHLDQLRLFERFDTNLDCQIHHRHLTRRSVRAFNCPSDPRAGGPVQWQHPAGPHPVWGAYYEGDWGTTNYLGISGTTGMQSAAHFSECDRIAGTPRHRGLHAGVFYGNSHTRLRDITDGTSTTTMLAERGVVDEWGKWGGAGVVFACPFGVLDVVMPGVIGTTGGGLRRPRGTTGDRLFLWSWHDAGSHVGLADASVRFVSYSVDKSVQRALATRSGGEAVTEW